jgi:hypothetical protein
VFAPKHPGMNAPTRHRAALSHGLQKEPPVRRVVKGCFVSGFAH